MKKRIVDRPPLRWPNGARVAVWVIPNIEHFLFDRPSTRLADGSLGLNPDVLNYSWRDYGVRVGIWRMMEVMERYGVKGTVALNSDVCKHYPRIIEEGKKLDWEWMGHGQSNSVLWTGLDMDKERVLIRDVLDVIERACGVRPRGWLNPALTETLNTPDLLAEAGVDLEGGPIRILAMPRILGHVFNPIAVWFAYGPEEDLRAVLYEVSNTFGERLAYLCPVTADGTDPEGRIRHRFAKQLYVSPFIGMDAAYDFRTVPPTDRVALVIREAEAGDHVLTATLVGNRRPFTSRELWSAFATHPLVTLKVVAAIHG